jgi:hypothetical protein
MGVFGGYLTRVHVRTDGHSIATLAAGKRVPRARRNKGSCKRLELVDRTVGRIVLN